MSFASGHLSIKEIGFSSSQIMYFISRCSVIFLIQSNELLNHILTNTLRPIHTHTYTYRTVCPHVCLCSTQSIDRKVCSVQLFLIPVHNSISCSFVSPQLDFVISGASFDSPSLVQQQNEMEQFCLCIAIH